MQSIKKDSKYND